MILQAAIEGHVLVKNVNKTLPLRSPKLLSLFGFDGPAPLINNPAGVSPSRWNLGAVSVDISDISLLQAVGTGMSPQVASMGTLTFGGGSGAGTGPYISSPFAAFDHKAWEEGFALHWDFHNQSPDVNPATDACIVFVNEFASEAFDRPGLADARADTLVQNVATKCESTIVVVHNAGVRLVDAWIEHPNVRAVIFAHLPGQDSGRALVDIVFGAQSPSGRLPYTIAKRAEDDGHLLAPLMPGPPLSRTHRYPQSKRLFLFVLSKVNNAGDFNETLYIDYRAFMLKNITPRYEFGHGLSYTTFEYSNLEATWTVDTVPEMPPDADIIEGGLSSLFDGIATVSFEITNTGTTAAAEVGQLYVATPNAPAKQLRGFIKKHIEPGKTERLRLSLTRRDLSIWDVVKQQWILQKGEYTVHVGRSVLDTPLQVTLRS